MRIVGSTHYPNSPGTPSAVARLLSVLRSLNGHAFWPDDISLFDSKRIDPEALLDSAQVTDSYLLALAAAHHGQLATFERHLVTDAVFNGAKALCSDRLVPTSSS